MPLTLEPGQQRELNIQLQPIAAELARLFGTISDAGLGILGASIHLFENGVELYNAIADVNGFYEILNIEPGVYDGLVQAEGYVDYPF